LTGADDPETAEVVLLRAAKILSAL
jgi:hypothetical protein